MMDVLRRPVTALQISLRAIVNPHAEFGLSQPRGRAIVVVGVLLAMDDHVGWNGPLVSMAKSMFVSGK